MLLSLNTTVPLCVPTVVLGNDTVIVHEADGPTLVPHVLLSMNAPVVEMLVIARAADPVLVRMTCWVGGGHEMLALHAKLRVAGMI